MVHSIMRHVAETTGQDLEQLYKQIAWPMYKVYGHAFEAFKNMVQDPEPVFAKLQVLLATCRLKLSCCPILQHTAHVAVTMSRPFSCSLLLLCTCDKHARHCKHLGGLT